MSIDHTTKQRTEHRSFTKPDETRTFGNGHLDILRIGGADIGRLVLTPGWRWSEHDAWVVGDDDVVVIDWFGASEYAK